MNAWPFAEKCIAYHLLEQGSSTYDLRSTISPWASRAHGPTPVSLVVGACGHTHANLIIGTRGPTHMSVIASACGSTCMSVTANVAGAHVCTHACTHVLVPPTKSSPLSSLFPLPAANLERLANSAPKSSYLCCNLDMVRSGCLLSCVSCLFFSPGQIIEESSAYTRMC